MKNRYRVFRPGWGTYYCEDLVTKKQTTLRTSDKDEAFRLVAAKNKPKTRPPSACAWHAVRKARLQCACLVQDRGLIALSFAWFRRYSSSMALTTRHKLVKSLQTAFPRGAPFDHQQLAKLGVSSALAHHYLKSGWLVRLGRGVFTFPNDTLRREDCLKFLSRRVTGLHVGGKTALAWRGIRHNIPARELLSLWGEGKANLPEWFQKLFPSRYTARNPFSFKLPRDFGLQPLPEAPDGVLVSVPERALLEMLSEVGVHQGIEEARNIMEGARSLRPEVLATLLRNCRRVKVVRLCVSWAEELDLQWAVAAKKTAQNQLGHGRWTNRLKDGTILVLKR